MTTDQFDPAERAEQKRRSRERDEQALESGEITPDDLQWINGGQGMFRKSVLVRTPKPR